MPSTYSRRRFSSNAEIIFRKKIILLAFLLVAAIIGLQLYSLQITQGEFYRARALNQQNKSVTVEGQRGSIFLAEGDNAPLAISNRCYSIYLKIGNPLDDTEKFFLANSEVLTGDQKIYVQNRLSGQTFPKTFQYKIFDDLTADEKASMFANNKKFADKFSFEEKWCRVYPQGTLANYLVGFVNQQGVAQYGLEAAQNSVLKGSHKEVNKEVDAHGNEVFPSGVQVEDGSDIYLTINGDVQNFIEGVVSNLEIKLKAKSVSIIVQDPSTGAILGMATNKGITFDPNNYQDAANEAKRDTGIFLEPIASLAYEPGSVFKTITMAAALETGAVTPETTFFNNNIIYIGKTPIRNSVNHDVKDTSMSELLQWSLNVGAVFVEQQLGKTAFAKYVEDFGFGKATGIELNEAIGSLANLKNNNDLDYANMSFGQGLMVTPIQMINSYSAIANGGKVMRPYIIDKVVSSEGQIIETQPQVLSRPVSEKTCQELTSMLVDVVSKAYGKKASVPGYFIAGKTGTAQKIVDGKYSTTKTEHTFIGFAPALNPKFTVLIIADEPQGINFSEDSVTPAFSEVAKFLFQKYGIAPDFDPSLPVAAQTLP